MEAVIFTGIQASGKSTLYRRLFFRTHVRISLDLLRTRHRESVLLHTCIDLKQPFVVDNTNPTREERARYIEPARAAGFTIIGYYFRSKVEDSLRRNALREGVECIPAKGIRGTAGRLQLPSRNEGFDVLRYVVIGNDGEFIIEEWQDEI